MTTLNRKAKDGSSLQHADLFLSERSQIKYITTTTPGRQTVAPAKKPSRKPVIGPFSSLKKLEASHRALGRFEDAKEQLFDCFNEKNLTGYS